jgi:DNA-binding GntR family transcriptional regulator
VEGNIDRMEPVPMLRQRIFETLEGLIVEGTLSPGQHLVETELAERLGVSRGPVREALQNLSRDGWVELRPRQGAFVRQPTRPEIEEFFHVRSLLEAECARLAALHVEAGDEQMLRALLTAGRAATESGDERELVAANARLHMTIAELARNATLYEIVQLLRKRSQWFFTPVSRTRARTAWKEHQAVVEAIVDGDQHRAAELLKVHIDGTRRTYHELAPAREDLAHAPSTDAAVS